MQEQREAPAASGPRGLRFQGERLGIGEFVARPGEPWFSDSGPARGHLVVFPRLPVLITHAGGAPVVADPTRVMFYNLGQEYRRARIAPAGDRCVWLSLAQDGAVEAVRAHDPRVSDRPERPFARTHGPCDARSYLAQRLLLAQVTRGAPVDPLEFEEIGLRLVDRVLGAAHGTRAEAPQRAHAALADAVRTILAHRFAEPLALADIARAAGASPFHLARVFHRHAGHTIAGHREALRLSLAIERLADGDDDLTALALDLGYGSHSHFTCAFRRRLGLPPSRVRRLAAGGGLDELRRLAALPAVTPAVDTR